MTISSPLIASDITQAINQFFDKIKHSDSPQVQWIPISEARDKSKIKQQAWANLPGIYLFIRANTIVYVGRALKATGLMSRVNDHATALGDAEWDDVIKDDKTVVGLLPLSENDSIWVASLELYLIDYFGKPHFNKRH